MIYGMVLRGPVFNITSDHRLLEFSLRCLSANPVQKGEGCVSQELLCSSLPNQGE